MVSQEDLNKAVKAAKASATRAAGKKKATRKKGKKWLKPVKTKTLVKHSYAKLQRKHPVVTTLVVAAVGAPIVTGLLDAALPRMPVTYAIGTHKIPFIGKPIAHAANEIGGKILYEMGRILH